MMSIKSRIGRAGGIAAAVAAAAVAIGVGGAGAASAAPAAPAALAAPADKAPLHGCVFQTVNGHYVTAVGAGGRTTDVIHTDATQIGSWEKFTLVDSGVTAGNFLQFGFLTANGHYLTAVGGGGRITDVIHSDATQLQAWERFTLHYLGNGQYDIETVNGHFLTAVGGGGRTTDTIHSDATQVGSWEKFTITCGH
jgi:hypothetical protein